MTYMQDMTTSAHGGDEPMSERQADMLLRLCREAGDQQGFDPALTRRQAARRIEALIDEIRMALLPPHTD